MSDLDELDINPFFNALQSKFLSTYEKVQEECYHVCIPQSDCLHGVTITQKFVDTHILKPSPFFKGQYTTLRSERQNDQQVVSIEDDGNHIRTLEGFPTRTKIKIICEELGYNKEYKPYKILIIARPLDHNVLRHGTVDTTSGSGEFKLKFTVKDCRGFLNSFPEFSKSLTELDDQINKFLKSYIVLKDYLEAAARKLQDIATSTSQNCLKSLKDRKLSAPKLHDNVTTAVETCLVGSVSQKLYPVIISKFSMDDRTLLQKCCDLQGLTPEQLAVPKQFSCPVTSAVVELAHLQSLVTPLEKLYCLKTTIDNLTEEINRHVRASQPLGKAEEDMPCLTSDELLPILATVIVQAKCRHIHSDIYYIDNFYWSDTHRDKDTLSYCLVTFKAAVQYLMSTDFSDIDLKTHGAKNEINLQELVNDRRVRSSHVKESQGQPSSDGSGRSYPPSRSRYDQQMDNITRMLEESTKDMKPNTKKIVKQPIVASIFGGNEEIILRDSNPEPPDLEYDTLLLNHNASLHVLPLLGQGLSVSPVPDEKSQVEKQSKQEDMGDFLSSLQNDMFLSYGKQT